MNTTENGDKKASVPLFESKDYPVETAGDGSGQFLWPKQRRSDGKWFGFDADILATKRAQYLNKIHFRAQYYNDPHDVDNSPIQRDLFQYYDQTILPKGIIIGSSNGNVLMYVPQWTLPTPLVRSLISLALLSLALTAFTIIIFWK